MNDILLEIFTLDDIDIEMLRRDIGKSNLTQENKEELWDIFDTISTQIKEYKRLGWVEY